jgi:hypothetical protein
MTVTFTSELLDTDKDAVSAYLWKESPFLEVQMDRVSENKFIKTTSGFSNGQTVCYACKFAFADGLAVTKYLSYNVGDNCVLSTQNNFLARFVKLFPNPTNKILNLSSQIKPMTKVEVYSVTGKKVLEFNRNLEKLNIEKLSSGLYLIKISSNEESFIAKCMKE